MRTIPTWLTLACALALPPLAFAPAAAAQSQEVAAGDRLARLEAENAVLRQEMRTLRDRLDAIEARLGAAQAPSTPGEPYGATRTDLGSWLLAREGKDLVAFRFVKHTSKGDGGAIYEWVWEAADKIERGEGEVFEKYKRGANGYVTDDGGQLLLKCGPFTLEWSAGDWVYVPKNRAGVAIAATTWRTLAEVDPNDPKLRWIGAKPAAAATSTAAEKVRADVKAFADAIILYHNDCGQYPSSLEDLIQGTAEGWDGPYIKGGARAFLDPWKRPYIYQFHGGSGNMPYTIGSYGADGAPGGDGEDRDIFPALR